MTLRRAILVAASVFLMSTAGYSADFLMGRYSPDQRSYTPERLQLPVALSWEFAGDKFENNPAAPVTEGNRCFIACGDRIYAVDLETGKELWKYPTGAALSSVIKSTPLVNQGLIYFGAGDGNLYCLDGATGHFKWAYQTRGAIRCSPVIYEGIIYFGTDDNSIYAVDAASGESVWSKPFTANDDMAYGLAVNNGVIVVSCMDGNMYGLSASVGKLKWRLRLPTAPVRSWPIISDGVAIMALGNLIYGFTAASGQTRWLIQLPSEVAANPACDGNTLYVACRDQKVYAYNIKTRQPVTKWTAPAEFGTLAMSPPVVADDTLFVTGSKGVVAAFSTEDGTLTWRYMIAPSFSSTALYTDAASSPTVSNGSLLVHTEDGVLHCFTPGAPDAEKPQVHNRKPGNATAIPAVPPFRISALVYDIGSGVDFSSINVQMDGQTVEHTVDFATSTVSAIYGLPVEGRPAKSLSNGIHTIRITGRDYMGNELSDEWMFFADSSLTPPKRPVVETGRRTTEPPAGNTDRGRNQMPPRPDFGRGRSDGSDGNQPPPPPPPPVPAGVDWQPGAAPQAPPVYVE